MRRAILNSSGEGHIVFDPFLGSGTTMIACDHTRRACRGIDIDCADMASEGTREDPLGPLVLVVRR